MKILYVDDDSEDREIFIEILEEIDPAITVVEASNGIETISILASEDLPDIIFLDINMPLLNGDQTLVEIRKDERLNNTKVVMYSTYVSQTSIPTYENLNAQYLNKPFTVKDGVDILRHVIKGENQTRPY
jgi:CheY-like chemotaxis protein